MNINKRDEWRTPQWLFDILNKQYLFIFDCCASKENTKCGFYDSSFLGNTGMDQMSWMNPPFSEAYEMFEHFFKVVKRGVAIYRCDNMKTKVWQQIIFKNADWIFIPNTRIKYEGLIGKGCRFPSALVGYNVISPEKIDGTLLKVIKRLKANEI